MYSKVAVLFLNSCVLFLMINIILGLLSFIKDRQKEIQVKDAAKKAQTGQLFNLDGSPINNGKRTFYQEMWFDFNAIHAGNQHHVSDVLDDFSDLESRGFIYQPWVQFSEPLFEGKYVHVDRDEFGFPIRRTSNPIAKAPIEKVFILGGSTTFGYNVADQETWPSYLSDELQNRYQSQNLSGSIQVVNYGHGFYNTSQETVFLIDILKTGQRPSLVIFLDGVNWGLARDVPQFTDEYTARFRQVQFQQNTWFSGLNGIPIIRFIHLFQENKRYTNQNSNNFWWISRVYASDNEEIIYQTNRFIQNQKIAAKICELYEITCLFFLQPDARFNYPLSLYRTKVSDKFIKDREKRERLYTTLQSLNIWIDLTGLFHTWGDGKKAIVDDVHYSPEFNKLLALEVAKHIDIQELVKKPYRVDMTLSTGDRR